MILASEDNISIAVIGSSSMVGSRFCELGTGYLTLIKADLHGEKSIDITSLTSTNLFFQNNNFNYVILFSAFTDVDAAEKERNNKSGLCWGINVEGVQNVVYACQMLKKNLVFVSTDFVFDGKSGPYSEEDSVGGDLNKVSWYGITKLEGEKRVREGLTNYIIVRISYPYRAHFPKKDDFAKSILRKFSYGSLYPMFSDQIISPTFIDDLAPAVKLLIEQRHTGIFHVASPKLTTPYDFAQKLISRFGGDSKKIKNGSILNAALGAPRPIKGGLLTDKIKKLGFIPTNWKAGIEAIFSQSSAKLI